MVAAATAAAGAESEARVGTPWSAAPGVESVAGGEALTAGGPFAGVEPFAGEPFAGEPLPGEPLAAGEPLATADRAVAGAFGTAAESAGAALAAAVRSVPVRP